MLKNALASISECSDNLLNQTIVLLGTLTFKTQKRFSLPNSMSSLYRLKENFTFFILLYIFTVYDRSLPTVIVFITHEKNKKYN